MILGLSLSLDCLCCSIGIPVLRQSLIPSSLLVVFIVIMQTVAKRVLPVRLTVDSEEAQEPSCVQRRLQSHRSAIAMGFLQYGLPGEWGWCCEG